MTPKILNLYSPLKGKIIDLSKDFDMPVVKSDDKGRVNLSVAFAHKQFRIVPCRGKKIIVLEVIDNG